MSDWGGVNVLVTGGEGFIGSHLTEALVAAGANVRVLSYYTSFGGTGWLDPALGVEVMPGDVRDAGRVREAVEGRDVVFHLAALIGIPYSYVAPESYIQTNVQGSFNVADACRRAGVSRLVHTSTSETYGTALHVPIGEDHPLQPQSPYSASKIGGDMMVLSLHHAFELPVAVARPFNTYGPRQSTRAVIPTILSQLLGGAKEVRLGSLTPTRDFNYATDTAAGMMAIARCDACIGSVTNIGSGQEISVGDLAQLLIEATGADAKVVLDESRVRPGGSEVDRLLADNTKIHQLTGWAPQVSLRDGLSRTAEWIRTHLNDLETGNYSV
ncbi:MAG TPA: GDP-mannose 4,6-dehydratase [Acidimicrobiales bacterium]|nr:GDP-mannose 4,6-dehydratase [Acidimicrobiales bacterium]